MKLPFAIYDLRFTIREESAGGTGVTPVVSGVAPETRPPAVLALRRGRQGEVALRLVSPGCAVPSQIRRDAGFDRRDACSTRLAFNPPCSRTVAAGCKSSIINHKSQSGVALVLTLILLSVALVMTLAFLAISGREQGSVTTQTDTATTRLAADAGLAAAEAQIAANVLSTTNPYGFGLLVSTNYQPYLPPFTTESLTNQWISPRPPVAISQNGANDFRFYLDLNRNGVDDPNGYVVQVDNNNNVIGTNYNAVGDPEWIGVLERPDQPYGPNNPFIARFAFIALPVGNSLDLNAIHNQALLPPLNYSANPMNSAGDSYFRNQGVGSSELNLAAFLADLNTNEWDGSSGGIYKYLQPNFANSGEAFYDAFALLTNRYAGNYRTLATVQNLFGLNGVPAFQNNIDAYGDGPLQTTTAGINEINQNVTWPWAGADNTNHFFTPGELFNTNETAAFGNDLLNAGASHFGGTTTSTYDRYTFYRMLTQLGTDTAPESGKMNLNYDNLDSGSNGVLVAVGGTTSAANFVPWTPLGFFNNAADRMLKACTAQWAVSYIPTNPAPNVTNLMAVPNPNFAATFNVTAPFGVTSIPVLVSNRFVYTPAVHRLLQLAANMYDATTTNHYPDIFRPVFSRDQNGLGTNIFIIGYTNQPQITSFINHDQAAKMVPGGNGGVLDPPIEVTALPLGTNILANVYGVPWIIGAKKGFPNFNAFSVETAFQLVRKLEVERDITTTPPTLIWTNQMYLMSITNYMGLSCWNSYRSNYAGPVDIVVRCGSSIMLTNDNNLNPPYTFMTNFAFATEFSTWPDWDGVAKQQANPSSFVVPLATSFLTLTNAMYYYNEPNLPNRAELLSYLGDSPDNYLDKGIRELPHFWLMMTNRLQVAIIDYSAGLNNGRIVDYVQLGGMDSKQPLNSALSENDTFGFWNTNGPPTGQQIMGVWNQIDMSEHGTVNGHTPPGSGVWSTTPISGLVNDVSPAAQQAFFRAFFAQNSYEGYGGGIHNTLSAMQAPYTPTVFVIQHTTWEANDPLVHYLSTDLALHTDYVHWDLNNLRVTNDRYQPWGLPPPSYVSALDQDQNPANLAFKDPLVRESDSWDFPAGKLPTAGWLGRVHRGTPWQTIDLKATNILAWNGQNGLNTWKNWTGDKDNFDAANAAPVDDHLLFDLFTTTFTDNATRGQLSVNTAPNSLAAWSAVFSGIVTLSNNLPNSGGGGINNSAAFPPHFQNGYPPPGYTNLIINPAGGNGMNSALGQIVAGIDRRRATFTNADGLVGAFEHQGDILATPELTERSPFLNWNNTAQQNNGISDEMYEWLPQQAMSLLRVGTPRYVIYSYGQALKPAPNGTYLGGATLANGQPAFGMVTNYQVVAEVATRAVVRLDTVRTNDNGAIIVTPPRAVIESFNILPPD